MLFYKNDIKIKLQSKIYDFPDNKNIKKYITTFFHQRHIKSKRIQTTYT